MKHKKFVISLIAISLLLIIVLKTRKITFIEKVLKDFSLNIVNVISTPVNNQNEINEYEELKKYTDELQYEFDRLKGLLEIKNILSDYEIVNATIINRNLGYWYDNFTIDKGSNDGLEINMAVVNESGLIGYIEEITYTTSSVKMITSKLKNKISVKIDNNKEYIHGILTEYKDGYFRIEGVGEDVMIDSMVTTTGFSSLFPSGIVIGKVKEIIKDNFDLARIYIVKPEIDYNLINFVSVLKREI